MVEGPKPLILPLTHLPSCQKVILIGGFAASPSLSQYLSTTLAQISEFQARKVQLLRPKIPYVKEFSVLNNTIDHVTKRYRGSPGSSTSCSAKGRWTCSHNSVKLWLLANRTS